MSGSVVSSFKTQGTASVLGLATTQITNSVNYLKTLLHILP